MLLHRSPKVWGGPHPHPQLSHGRGHALMSARGSGPSPQDAAMRMTGQRTKKVTKGTSEPTAQAEFDPNADLMSSLMAAAAGQLARSLTSAQDAMGSGLGRVMRLIEPPPRGACHAAP